MKRYFQILIFCLASITVMHGQGFEAKAFTGFTLSQMEGDLLAGFDKLGFNGGVQVLFHATDKVLVGMEIGYIQKGSRQGALDIQVFASDAKTTLNYAELPVLVELRDWYNQDDGFYRIAGHLGLSYAFLISAESDHPIIGEFIDDYGNDLSFIAGGTFNFTDRLATTVRYQRALNQFLKNEDFNTGGLLNFLWTLRLEYVF